MEGHTGGSGQGGNSGFHTVFHGGYKEMLLFTDLHIISRQQFVGACVVVFVLGLLNEGLRLLVAWLGNQTSCPAQQSTRSDQMIWVQGLGHTLTYILHLFVHYCLMLLFMTLNVWLCLSLLLGSGLGFILFHFRPVRARVFRFFGIRDQGLQEKGEKEEEENYSEMTDMPPEHPDDFRWNGGSKK